MLFCLLLLSLESYVVCIYFFLSFDYSSRAFCSTKAFALFFFENLRMMMHFSLKKKTSFEAFVVVVVVVVA